MVGCNAEPEPLPAPARTPVVPRVPNLEREVDVFVNHDRVATLSADEVAAGVALDRVLFAHPFELWQSIVLYRDGADTIEWLDPAANFGDLVPLVYLDGDRPAAAFVAEGDVATRANPVVHARPITAVRVLLRKPVRTALDAVGQGCVVEAKGEQPQMAAPEHWKGTTLQFNIPMHWRTDLRVHLGAGPPGDHVGVLTQHAVEWTEQCIYDLYRMADRKDRRAVKGVLRRGEGGCTHVTTYELTCSGTDLALWGYYGNGTYVERGVLTEAP